MSLLYEYYSNTLYGLVYRIIHDEEKAKDVMQESFMKVWKNIDKYDREKSKLFTWLLRIFRNTAIDELRRNKRFNENQRNISSPSDGGTNDFAVNQDLMDISKHLSDIDIKYRHVIEKIYMHGFTQVETSEALSIPLGTVKSRLRIGLSALRRIYIPIMIFLIIEMI